MKATCHIRYPIGQMAQAEEQDAAQPGRRSALKPSGTSTAAATQPEGDAHAASCKLNPCTGLMSGHGSRFL